MGLGLGGRVLEDLRGRGLVSQIFKGELNLDRVFQAKQMV